MGASTNFHIVSNRNNRNLTRADDRSFRRRTSAQVGKGYSTAHERTPTHPRERRIYRDHAAPIKCRVLAFVGFVAIVASLIYKLVTMWDM